MHSPPPPPPSSPPPEHRVGDRHAALFLEMYEFITAAAALKAQLEELRLHLVSPADQPSRRLLDAMSARLNQLRSLAAIVDELRPPPGLADTTD